MNSHIAPVDLAKAYRLLNHGPTVLVSAAHDGYIAGGHFYAVGEVLNVEPTTDSD